MKKVVFGLVVLCFLVFGANCYAQKPYLLSPIVFANLNDGTLEVRVDHYGAPPQHYDGFRITFYCGYGRCGPMKELREIILTEEDRAVFVPPDTDHNVVCAEAFVLYKGKRLYTPADCLRYIFD